MDKKRILIIEDEKKIARFLELELQYEGYQVDIANDGRTGLEMALKDEKRREEENLFVLSAKIIGESYYLKKSMNDIENTMDASHDIYLRIKESPLGLENPEISKKLINLSNNSIPYYR